MKPAADSSSAARRRASLPGPRAVALLLTLYAAVQTWIFAKEFPPGDGRTTLGLLLTAVALTAVATLRWPQPWLAALGMALAGAHVGMFCRALERFSLPLGVQNAAAGALLVAAATALAAALLLMRLARGGQALALALSLAGAAWTANAVWSARRPDLVGEPPRLPFRREGLQCAPHEIAEFGLRNRPNHTFRFVYPSNPRGYFHTSPVLAPLDAVRWDVLTSGGARAELKRPSDASGVARIEIHERTGDLGWPISATVGKLPILGGQRYELTLRARADAVRPARLMLNPTRPPFRSLGLERNLELTPEWQDVRQEFRALRDEPEAMLVLELGAADPAVEIAAAGLTPLDGQLDMSQWKSRVADDARAAIEPYTSQTRVITLRVSHAAPKRPGAVRIWQRGLTLSQEATYRLEFWARSDRPREILVSMHRPPDVLDSLGLQRSVSLETGWQAYQLPFTATESCFDGELQFMCGQQAGAVEISEAAILADDPAHRVVPVRYFVDCRCNSLGYRDHERAVEAADGVFRIVCLGDSFTFGAGVHEADRFTNLLEPLLNESIAEHGAAPSDGKSPPRYEVLNFGHSGYNTMQERLSYEHEAAQFRPRLALVIMVDNDDIPWRLESQLPAHQPPSHLERLFAPLGAQRKRQQARANRRFDVCVEELKLLKQRCDADGVRLAAVIFPNKRGPTWEELSRTMAAAAPTLGIPLLDLHAALFPKFEDKELWVHPDDAHPNEIAHRAAADAMANFLRQQGLLAVSADEPPAAAPIQPASSPQSESPPQLNPNSSPAESP